MKIELNGKTLLSIALISSGLVFADFVSLVDSESSGGIIVYNGVTQEELDTAINELRTEYDEKISKLELNQAPVGAVTMWGGSNVPQGWLEMNGQSIVGYTELSAIYGSNLPDLRGEFVRGWDNGRGIDSGRTLLGWQMASHIAHDEDGMHIHNYSDSASALKHGLEPSTMNVSANHSWSDASGKNYTFNSSQLRSFTSTVKPRNVSLMYIVKAENQ
jgi:microcystin-dependent protein